ncbi:MAG TPA: DNA polymerase I, partial [Ilumatobacteraceae bacterium]
GVGEKTAAKLINTYGGLDGIFANVDAQTPKLRASLAEHEERVRSNAELMVLRRDAPIDVDLTGLKIEPDVPAARKLFDFLEFRALTDRLFEALGSPAVEQSSSEGEFLEAEITDLSQPAAAARTIAGLPSLDVVVSWAGDPGRTDLIGIAIVTDRDACEVAWIPGDVVVHPDVLAAIASHPNLRGHNAKALIRWAFGQGVTITGLQMDVAIAAYLIDPADVRYALADLLQRYTQFQMPSNDASSAGQLDFSEEGDDNRRTAGRGALAVAHLAVALQAALDKQGMAELYATIENPLVIVLAEMEHVGIAVDMTELRRLNQHLTFESERLAAELQRVVGRPFNFNSPVQLRELLYTEKQLAPQKKTKTGYSTDAATLLRLRDEWPEFIDPLMQYREMEKLRGTYGTGLMAEVAPDGRIHATFNQTVARTGRLSSDQPNLHNIPVRSDEGRQFRKAFVPAPGYTLLVADYNQIELRCIAHLAADPGLVEAFRSGTDIHNATAARVFGVEPASVTIDQRSKAKMVSYGLAYGMESYGLGQRLGIPTADAAVILDAYFEAFPNVKAYMDRTVVEARMRGYTETLFGRRRPIPELSNSNFRIRQAGERMAMNAGIQGLAADIFKVALVRIHAALSESHVESRLILQVHDEVLVEVPEGEVDTVGPIVIDIMRNAARLDVPLEVNVSWGPSWASAKG